MRTRTQKSDLCESWLGKRKPETSLTKIAMIGQLHVFAARGPTLAEIVYEISKST